MGLVRSMLLYSQHVNPKLRSGLTFAYAGVRNLFDCFALKLQFRKVHRHTPLVKPMRKYVAE